MEKKKNVKGLIKALKNWEIRKEATEALGRIGDNRAVEPLINLLPKEYDTKLKAAAEALVKIKGAEAVEDLIPLLKPDGSRLDSSNDSNCTIIAKILGRIGDKRAVEPLIESMNKFHFGDTTTEIIKALGKIGGVRAVEGLITFMINYRMPSGNREKAARALVRIGDTNSIEALSRALKVSCCNEIAAKALEKLKWKPKQLDQEIYYLCATNKRVELSKLGKPAIEPLIKALNDKNKNVRQKAVEALGRIGDKRAVEPLINILSNEGFYAREEAVEALGMIGDIRAVEPLIEHMKCYKPGYSGGMFIQLIPIIKALGKLGDKRAVEPLINILSNEEIVEQVEAVEALGKIGDNRAVEPLMKLLRRQQEAYEKDVAKLKKATIMVLGEIRDTRAVEPIIGVLADENYYYYNIEERLVANALCKIGDPAIKLLIQALDNKNAQEKAA